MRIDQAFVSKSVADFPFHETHGLNPYYDSLKPCIFYGCYSDYDLMTIKNHKGMKVIHWLGQDALDAVFYGKFYDLTDCYHIAFHLNILITLKSFVDLKVKKVNPWQTIGEFTPSPLGDKVFAYCPQSAETYHRLDLIEQLRREIPYEIIIGDGRIPQKEWNEGKGNEIYNQCFVGLVLSAYAGGAQTIIQMGLKGRWVINNVLDLPNCRSWKSIETIKETIEFAHQITAPYVVTSAVKQSLDNLDFLNTEFYDNL